MKKVRPFHVLAVTAVVALLAQARAMRFLLAVGPMATGNVGTALAIYNGPQWLVTGLVVACGVVVAANWRRLTSRIYSSRD